MFRALDDIVKIAFANDVQKLPTDSEQKVIFHFVIYLSFFLS